MADVERGLAQLIVALHKRGACDKDIVAAVRSIRARQIGHVGENESGEAGIATDASHTRGLFSRAAWGRISLLTMSRSSGTASPKSMCISAGIIGPRMIPTTIRR